MTEREATWCVYAIVVGVALGILIDRWVLVPWQEAIETRTEHEQ